MENITERIKSIDVLRGLAVILMVEQHLGFWLWKRPVEGYSFSKFPLLISFNAMGGYAAPAFITLAGLGTAFFTNRHNGSWKVLVYRGLTLIAFGYLLNIMVPSWFSPANWYVLHMIGFGITISPLLKKINIPLLLTLIIIIIISSVLIQNFFNTPFYLNNRHMGNYNKNGGIFRLIFAEGQFPIFPWLSFFISGIVAGRWIVDKKYSRIIIFSIISIIVGTILALAHLQGFQITKIEPFKRLFYLQLGFYPANPPIVLILIGIVHFTIYAFILIEKKLKMSSKNPFVCLGRTSLTILFVHIVVFRQMGKSLKFWNLFSSGTTLLLIFIIITVFTFIAVLWEKKNFRFSLEWILRKIAG